MCNTKASPNTRDRGGCYCKQFDIQVSQKDYKKYMRMGVILRGVILESDLYLESENTKMLITLE